ncbi:hypothetical protein C8R43DRAFT_1139410 [Mycena crocata]|nr:hypothetical protein C8R43DRAFT_1139410 [Mycena crocata]
MTVPALDVQELCDTISDFLGETWDLKSCALVSPPFTRAAQRHLFHDILLNRGCLDIDDVSTLEWYDEAAACRRLFGILEASPHLIPYVRRLRVALERDTLQALSTVTFSNLREVIFHRRAGGAAEENTIALAARLLSSPFIHRVGLMGTIFSGKHDLQRLFRDCPATMASLLLHHVIVRDAEKPTALPQRRKIETLHIKASYSDDISWLHDSASPFNISGLVDLTYRAKLTPDVRKLLEQSRRSIRRLSVDAQYAANEMYADTRQPELLARFPALTQLTLACNAREPGDAETLLVALPPVNSLQSLKLELKNARHFDQQALMSLGVSCANLDCTTVVVYVRRVAAGGDVGPMADAIKAAFKDLVDKGRLEVLVR